MKHNLIMPRRRGVIAGTVTGLAGLVLAFGTPSGADTATEYFGCTVPSQNDALYKGAVHIVNHPLPAVCHGGRHLVKWSQSGPAGAPGQDLTNVSVTAATAVTGWPEGSGWATDQFTRTLNLTRQHSAESTKCGGTPECWFYTGTVTDQGTFTTTPGATAPNGSHPVTIAGVLSGSMVGGGHVEFYASSGAPDGSLAPATATGTAKPASTSDWYKLAFPDGTTFAGGSLTQYKWTYSATSPNTCETWVDAVNPGDDGQGPADGNITGVNACH